MKEITVRVGKFKGEAILVSDQDYPLVQKFHWNVFIVHGLKYARTRGRDGKQIYMHRMIMTPPADMVVDHINFNGLDNRRENLRILTLAENNRHRSLRTRSKSLYRGVYPDLLPNRIGYSARISVNKKRIYIGHYETAEEAARAYDHAAKQLLGDYAVLNFPPKWSPNLI